MLQATVTIREELTISINNHFLQCSYVCYLLFIMKLAVLLQIDLQMNFSENTYKYSFATSFGPVQIYTK